jgi:hypothetical protein
LEAGTERFIPQTLLHFATWNLIFIFSEAQKSFSGQFSTGWLTKIPVYARRTGQGAVAEPSFDEMPFLIGILQACLG